MNLVPHRFGRDDILVVVHMLCNEGFELADELGRANLPRAYYARIIWYSDAQAFLRQTHDSDRMGEQ